MKTILFALCTVLCLAITAQAAVLNGQTISTEYLFPDTGTVLVSPVDTVVGLGTGIPAFAGLADIVFSDTNILITLIRDAGVNDVPFDGFHFFDTNGMIPAFTDIVLNAATNYAGFGASDITFDADNIFINVANLPGLMGQVISLDINPSTSIPEPSSILLLSAGLAGVSIIKRRFKH
jgi:hypothetical protein